MRSQKVALGVIALLVGFAVVVGAAVTFVNTSGTISLQTNSGVNVSTSDHGGGMDLTSSFPDDETVELVTQNGNVTVSGQNPANLTVSSIDSPTTVQGLDANGTSVRVAPENGDALRMGGWADSIQWTTITVGDGNTDVTTTLSGSQAVNLTLTGLAPNTNYKAVDASGTMIDAASSDGSGTAAFDIDQSASVEFETYDNPLPTVTNLSPDGGTVSTSVTLEADIDDDSLPGQNVTVEYRVDGSLVETRNITSAGTESYTLTSGELPSAGEHDWSVTATDQLGASTTKAATFGVPGNMTVRNVSNTSEVIPNAEVTIYGEDRSWGRTSDANGNVSLDGLPGDEVLYAELNHTDYHHRTMPLPTVVQAQNAFLLPKNESAVLVRFTLTDATGEFGPRSRVVLQRDLTLNGTNTYRTVAGDEFGTGGFDVLLKEDQRYRVRVVSEDGSSVAQMGSFTATVSEEVALRPARPALTLGDDETVAYNASVVSGSLKIQYDDPENETEVLTVYAVNRFNDSEYLLDPQTHYDTDSLALSEPVPGGELQDSYIVVIEGQRDGETFRVEDAVGPEQISLLPPGLSTVWIQIGGIGMVLLVGGVFSRLNAGVGALVTSLFAGLLWYAGLLSGVATWAAVALAIVFSVLYAMVLSE